MPNKPAYPAELERAWLDIALKATGLRNEQTAVAQLEQQAGFLSDAFTKERDPEFAGYASNRRALAAYGLFFFPRAYVRTLFALRECAPADAHKPKPGPLRIVDLGAGTGAAGLAAAQAWSARHPERFIELELVDQATEGFKLARDLFAAGKSLWPRATLVTTKADARTYAPAHGADLVVCSFAVNEWMEAQGSDAALIQWTRRLVQALRPGGALVLLEPAQRFAVERIERLRDTVAAERIGRILAPCPHYAACPMLAQKKGWCHEVRTWRVPDSLRWINRKLQRDIHLLKFSLLAVAHEAAPETASDWMRIISPVREEKGKYAFHGCGADGQIHACEWLTRGLSEEQAALSAELERGDRVRWTPAKTLGDGQTERADGPPALVV